VDNGFLQLNRVRIPRCVVITTDPRHTGPVTLTRPAMDAHSTELLSRNARVHKGGAYERGGGDSGSPSLFYAGMLTVRAGMVIDAARYLAQSVTIAVRYLSAGSPMRHTQREMCTHALVFAIPPTLQGSRPAIQTPDALAVGGVRLDTRRCGGRAALSAAKARSEQRHTHRERERCASS
jgi:hypothetical protein